MKKTTLVTAVVLVASLGAVFSYKAITSYLSAQAKAKSTPGPSVVSAAKVQQQMWQSSLHAVGSLSAVNGVDIMPQVDGVVSKIAFQSGQMVQQGDALIDLDTTVLQAQLDSAEASLKLAQATFKRYTTLFSKGAVTDDDLDKSRVEMNQADASVRQLQAQIAQMQIKAPFAGKVGLREVNVGQYIAAGTVVSNLQSVDPIEVNFALPSQHLNEIKVGQTVHVTVDSLPGKTFSGTLSAMDAKVDQSTRSIKVRAQLANPNGELYPGLFASIELLLATQENVITVPQSAIDYTLYGDAVYVVKMVADKVGKAQTTVKRQYVKVGERRGDQVVIVEGLNVDDQVVTSGQFKLNDGAKIKIDNSVEL